MLLGWVHWLSGVRTLAWLLWILLAFPHSHKMAAAAQTSTPHIVVISMKKASKTKNEFSSADFLSTYLPPSDSKWEKFQVFLIYFIEYICVTCSFLPKREI